MKNSLDYEINHNYRSGYTDGFADGYAEAWVPVTDALPDAGKKVLIYIRTETTGEGIVDTGVYQGGEWRAAAWRIFTESVTHWMPLPAAPKKGEDDGAY